MSSKTRALTAEATSVLIVSAEAPADGAIESQLLEAGYEISGIATDRERALWLYEVNAPTLLVVDVGSNDNALPQAAVELMGRGTPAVIVSAAAGPQAMQSALEAGAYGFLVKPTTATGLGAQLQIAAKRCAEARQLASDKVELTEALETRKLVDRAKGILMKRLNIPEADAHKRLQQESQKRRISLRELSRKIIDSEELLSGNIG